jgi:hypothetical protein
MDGARPATGLKHNDSQQVREVDDEEFGEEDFVQD